MLLRNFLPQDTRAVELASAQALCLVSVGIAVGVDLPATMEHLHPSLFWSVCSGLLGLLQATSLAGYPLLEPLRCWTALLCGATWVWLGLSGHATLPDFAAASLGLTNLYGFAVGFLFLKKSWVN